MMTENGMAACLWPAGDRAKRVVIGSFLVRLLLALFACFWVGCAPVGEDEIVVATNWNARDCRDLETRFMRWSSAPAEAFDQPTKIRWVRLAPGDDPALVADRLRSVDIVLGGLGSSYERLAAQGKLAGPEVTSDRVWIIARRERVGAALNPERSTANVAALADALNGDPGAGINGRWAIGDPRSDPTMRSLAEALLRDNWARGYGNLIRLAAQSRRISAGGVSSLAAVEQGRASQAVAVAVDLRGTPWSFQQAPRTIDRVQGAGMLKDSAHPERSAAFLRFVAGQTPQLPPVFSKSSPPADDLRDELLGAALVESQDELWAAWIALERAGWPAKRVDDLLKSPPWPPASIEKMKAKESSTVLLDTLAEQIASDPYDRGWLLELWDRPNGRVDGAFLEELATANGGRLGTNPRLRTWLRGEWIAWTRQNGRRVAREVEKLTR
jgi:hypothetical protein